MDFVEYKRRHCYGTYRTSIATIVLPSTQVHCLGRILIFWLLPFTSKKNKGAVSHGYSRNPRWIRVDESYSPLYSLSPDYVVGRSCLTDPAPFRFSPNTCLLKALCRCKDLNLASSYACLTNLTHLIPSDVCHQRQKGVFAALKSPPKKLGYAFLNRLKTNS